MRVVTVSAILVNGQGHVLLQLRDDIPGLIERGKWTLPGGRVERGETPAHAVQRELEEEFEVHPALEYWRYDDRLAWVGYVVPVWVRRHIFTGILDVPAERIVVNEGQAVRYFARAELRSLKIGFGFGELLARYFSERSS